MNPIIRLNKNYQSKFIDKLRNSFTDSQQQLFVASFFCYLNYNQKNDFVINLDDIWKWLGFERKSFCKRVLEKHFIIDIDYKIESYSPSIAGEKGFATTGEKAASPTGEPAFLSLSVAGEIKQLGGAGLNKEKIMMTIHTFKKLCLKSNTKKAEEIHEYYIKLEELTQEITNEESIELRKQLQIKEQELIEQIEINETEKQDLLEKTILDQFPENTQCIYYGEIDDVDSKGYKLAKYGNSNNLLKRIEQHKKTYTNFRLKAAFKVKNKIEIENAIKKHPILKKKMRSIIINGSNYIELLCIVPGKTDPDFSLEKLNEYIKEIIKEHEYNIENYNKLINKCDEYEKEILQLKEINKKLTIENEKLKNNLPSNEEKIIKQNNQGKNLTSGVYYLVAFHFKDDKYKVFQCKPNNIEMRIKTLQLSDPDGQMKSNIKLKHPFLEKVTIYLLKKHLLALNADYYQGSIDYINQVFIFIQKLEELLINNDISTNISILDGNKENIILDQDPEIPFIRKSKRPIDQIEKDTGKILASYPSIAAAGRAIGISGEAVGVALRNNSFCQGFLWRYSGISHEQQFEDQKVIRVNCNSGEKKYYLNIAAAAKEAQISAPGLRNRILTNLHVKLREINYHWIFDENDSSHYG